MSSNLRTSAHTYAVEVITSRNPPSIPAFVNYK